MNCSEHDWQPVGNMRAVYRCSACGAFGYKPNIRTDLGPRNTISLYRCHKPGCSERVVVMFPEVRARRRHQPSCEAHRPDRKRQAS
jgi:hypothetical protein